METINTYNANMQYQKYIQYLETSTYLGICLNFLCPLALEHHIDWLFELPQMSLAAAIDEKHNLKTYSVKPGKVVKEIMTFDGYFWHWDLSVQAQCFCLTSLPNQPAQTVWTAQGLILAYKCLCKCVLYELTYDIKRVLFSSLAFHFISLSLKITSCKLAVLAASL